MAGTSGGGWLSMGDLHGRWGCTQGARCLVWCSTPLHTYACGPRRPDLSLYSTASGSWVLIRKSLVKPTCSKSCTACGGAQEEEEVLRVLDGQMER